VGTMEKKACRDGSGRELLCCRDCTSEREKGKGGKERRVKCTVFPGKMFEEGGNNQPTIQEKGLEGKKPRLGSGIEYGGVGVNEGADSIGQNCRGE